MRFDDLIIGLAYLSMPCTWCLSLLRYSRFHLIRNIPRNLVVLGVLMAFFFVFNGIGHILMAVNLQNTLVFDIINALNAFFSVTAALYLLPMAPTLLRNGEKSYQDLVKLNEETAASKRKLFTFMNFLCHEIRNPLFAITSNIEFAQDMPMTPDLQESLTGIHQSAQLMLRLVNDVLDLSKIESGKLQLEPQLFHLQEFFQNMASTMGRQVLAKHRDQVAFQFEMAPDLPTRVQADSTRLLQICYNVLSNSNKFTERGAISFRIALYRGKKANPKKDGTQQETSDSTGVDLEAQTTQAPQSSAPQQGEGEQPNGMNSLENFSFSALGGKQSKRAKKETKKANGKLDNKRSGRGSGSSGGSSAPVPTISKLQSILSKSSASMRSLASSDLSMELSRSDPDQALRGGSSRHNNLEKNNRLAEINNNNQEEQVDDEGNDNRLDTVTLQLIFEDTGIGIEEEHLGRIFQPYTQSKLSDFRRHGGTGLGLSIIHKLLEMMEGTVQVTSKVGQGTKFVIFLPIKVAPLRTNKTTNPSNLMDASVETTTGAKLEDNSTVLMEPIDDNDEKADLVTPLSSVSSLNTSMVRQIRSAARYHNSPGCSSGTTSSAMSSQSSFNSVGIVDFSATVERDGAATPTIGNTKSLRVPQGPNPFLHNNGAQPALPRGSFEDSVDSLSAELSAEFSAASPGVVAQALFHSNPSTDDPAPNVAAPPSDKELKQPTPPTDDDNSQQQKSGDTDQHSTPRRSSSGTSIVSGASGDSVATEELSNLTGSIHAPQNNATTTLTPPRTPPRKNLVEVSSQSLLAAQQQKTTMPALFGTAAAAAAPPTTQSGLFSMTTNASRPPHSGLFSTTTANRPAAPGTRSPMPTHQRSPRPTASKPLPTMATTVQPKVRQLAKFNFPNNTNMVLLVDDNGVNRKLLGKMLTYFNLQYQDAVHGKQAVEIMERSQNFTGDESAPRFGLVLMDLCMPVMDGYEAIRQLRNKLNLKEVPILALTASAMEDEKQKALEAGATDFATKPLLRPALHKKCREYLQESNAQEQSSATS